MKCLFLIVSLSVTRRCAQLHHNTDIVLCQCKPFFSLKPQNTATPSGINHVDLLLVFVRIGGCNIVEWSRLAVVRLLLRRAPSSKVNSQTVTPPSSKPINPEFPSEQMAMLYAISYMLYLQLPQAIAYRWLDALIAVLILNKLVEGEPAVLCQCHSELSQRIHYTFAYRSQILPLCGDKEEFDLLEVCCLFICALRS